MNTFRTLTALGAATLFASGAAAQDVVDLRVGHLSPDAPAVDVLVDGAEVIGDLEFGSVTGYVPLFEGMYNIQVVVANTSDAVIDVDVMLESGVDYTVLAVNPVATIEEQILVDDNTIDTEDARVRFFHGSPDAPAVDVFVADGGPELFDSIEYRGVGDYIEVAPGIYDLEVRIADTSDVVLEVPNVTLAAGEVYTIYAQGFAFDEPALAAGVSLDNTINALVVQDPFPGLAGSVNGLRAKGAEPGQTVFFAAGFGAGTTQIPFCPGLSLDIANAQLAGVAPADALGEATFEELVPGAASGRTVLLQAVTNPNCVVSPVTEFTFN